MPTATDDHQRHNALALQQAGAAEVIEQQALSGERLAERIIALAARPGKTATNVGGGQAAGEAARRRRDCRCCSRSRGREAARVVSGVLAQARRIHFVGIGGIGMSGIAELLVNLGYEVSGSDMQRTDITDRLASLGARIASGHDARNVADAEVVVYSSAVRSSNPEMVAARERGLPVVPRAELLAELMQLREGIAIAGAHGKTTTTSMIALILEVAGLDPTAVIGGRVSSFGSNARLGRGKYLVAEADESDRSFLKLAPRFAVITNIDREHLEAYRDFDDLKAAFVQFANSVPANGVVILCWDDPHLRSMRADITAPHGDLRSRGRRRCDGDDIQMEGFGAACTVRSRSAGGRAVELGRLAALGAGTPQRAERAGRRRDGARAGNRLQRHRGARLLSTARNGGFSGAAKRMASPWSRTTATIRQKSPR